MSSSTSALAAAGTGHNQPRLHARDTPAEVKARVGPRVAAHLPFARSRSNAQEQVERTARWRRGNRAVDCRGSHALGHRRRLFRNRSFSGRSARAPCETCDVSQKALTKARRVARGPDPPVL